MWRRYARVGEDVIAVLFKTSTTKVSATGRRQPFSDVVSVSKLLVVPKHLVTEKQYYLYIHIKHFWTKRNVDLGYFFGPKKSIFVLLNKNLFV